MSRPWARFSDCVARLNSATSAWLVDASADEVRAEIVNLNRAYNSGLREILLQHLRDLQTSHAALLLYINGRREHVFIDVVLSGHVICTVDRDGAEVEFHVQPDACSLLSWRDIKLPKNYMRSLVPVRPRSYTYQAKLPKGSAQDEASVLTRRVQTVQRVLAAACPEQARFWFGCIQRSLRQVHELKLKREIWSTAREMLAEKKSLSPWWSYGHSIQVSRVSESSIVFSFPESSGIADCWIQVASSDDMIYAVDVNRKWRRFKVRRQELQPWEDWFPFRGEFKPSIGYSTSEGSWSLEHFEAGARCWQMAGPFLDTALLPPLSLIVAHYVFTPS